MAHIAHPKEVCDEIYEQFLQIETGLDAAVLRELANNYGYDATIDIDTNDIAELLVQPGGSVALVSEGDDPVICANGLLAQYEQLRLSAKVQPQTRAMFIVKNKRSLTGSELKQLLVHVRNFLAESFEYQAVYSDNTLPQSSNIRLMLLITGLA